MIKLKTPNGFNVEVPENEEEDTSPRFDINQEANEAVKYYEDNGYELIENKSFSTLYKDYKKEKLSNSELKFSSLYNFVVLKKL